LMLCSACYVRLTLGSWRALGAAERMSSCRVPRCCWWYTAGVTCFTRAGRVASIAVLLSSPIFARRAAGLYVWACKWGRINGVIVHNSAGVQPAAIVRVSQGGREEMLVPHGGLSICAFSRWRHLGNLSPQVCPPSIAQGATCSYISPSFAIRRDRRPAACRRSVV
jgi:hypothetical protein